MAFTDLPPELAACLSTLIEELGSPDTHDAAKMKLEHLKVVVEEALSKDALNMPKEVEALTTMSQGVPPVPNSSSNAAVIPTPTSPPPPVPSSSMYVPILTFAFDPGEYNSKSLSIYITAGMENIIDSKDSISCDFTETSFDLKVMGHEGKNFRLFKDNLAHNIDPSKSKYLVKQSKIVIKLAKCKGEFSYDHWESLTAKPGTKKGKKDDPQASIMSLMKDMYDGGDDDMKKMIGESMLKSQRGEKMDMDGMGGDF
ncbi:hypothetical protein TrCOL_g9862 [Triparma columacea]|uniref:Calcyclin-binding protein n=1 Tax=Triparma columacea TaxID=722753 RepID=A0A9W7LEY9_9STRA|nr:hypothetical protein TrCOL_g9862 [Triparma columacea]